MAGGTSAFFGICFLCFTCAGAGLAQDIRPEVKSVIETADSHLGAGQPGKALDLVLASLKPATHSGTKLNDRESAALCHVAAEAERLRGNLAEALKRARKAAAYSAKADGEESLLHGAVHELQGRIQAEQGKLGGAEEDLRESVRISQIEAPGGGMLEAAARNTLALVHRADGDAYGAWRHLARAWGIVRVTEHAPLRQAVARNMAGVVLEMNNPKSTVLALTDARDRMIDELGEGDPLVTAINLALSDVAARSGAGSGPS